MRSREGVGWLKVQSRAEFSIITQESECGAGTFLRVSGLSLGKPSQEGSPELSFREGAATSGVGISQLRKDPKLSSQKELQAGTAMGTGATEMR